MNSCCFGRRCLLSACVFAIAFASQLHARPTTSPPASPEISYSFAVQALNRGDTGEALSWIQAAISANPNDMNYQYVLGIVYSKMQRWEEAEGIFVALINLDENAYRAAYFDLAYVYLQKGEAEKALQMVEKAKPVDPGRAYYEAGVVSLRLKKHAEARDSFGRAALEKPELAPRAKAQEAIALINLKEYKKAKELLLQVLEMKLPPQSEEEVRKMLKALEAVHRADKPWQISATLGYQFDDNVFQTPLQQANFQVVRQTSNDKDDAGFLASVAGKYDIVRSEPWKFGVGYAHYSITYGDNSNLDAVGARPSVYVNWEHDPFLTELQYVYSHYWVGGSSWLDSHSILPKVSISIADHWRTDLTGGAEWHNYDDATPDDVLYFGGVTETYLLREGKANVRAGYLGGVADLIPAEGADYVFHEALLGVQWPIWKDKWFVDLSGRYILRDFELNRSFSLTESRFDQERNLNFYLYGQLTNYLQLAFLYQRIWNDSNIDDVDDQEFFNYTRNVFTCMVTFNF